MIRGREDNVPFLVRMLSCIRECRTPSKFRAWSRRLTMLMHRCAIGLLLAIFERWNPRSLSFDDAVALHEGHAFSDKYSYDAKAKEERANERYRWLSGVIELGRVKSIL